METYCYLSHQHPIPAPKTSLEVELMETCLDCSRLGDISLPKTSLEVELMETRRTLRSAPFSSETQNFFGS